MPAVWLDTSHLKEILASLPELPPHNWLISGLECYDDCGWDGCEKWAKTELFLSDEVLLRDVNQRNMQIIWGVFSAIPQEYSWEEIRKYPAPETETAWYLCDHIQPQHPLALLELYVDDGCCVIASARDASLLQPLYNLPYHARDEEADNRKVNAQLRRIRDMLRKGAGDVSAEVANQIQWKVWHSLFKGAEKHVEDSDLYQAVMTAYHTQDPQMRTYGNTVWDPYEQKQM